MRRTIIFLFASLITVGLQASIENNSECLTKCIKFMHPEGFAIYLWTDAVPGECEIGKGCIPFPGNGSEQRCKSDADVGHLEGGFCLEKPVPVTELPGQPEQLR